MNRVAVMLTNAELAKLKALAKKRQLSLSTLAYHMIKRSIARTK